MCLSKVIRTYNPPKEEEGEGYKVVIVEKCHGVDTIDGIFFHHHIPKNQWGVALQSEVYPCKDIKYVSGYHIFKNLEDGDSLYRHISSNYWTRDGFIALVKVKYRKVLAEGNGARPVDALTYTEEVVAAEMYWDGNIVKQAEPGESENLP
jgi:hypothetical protein